MREDPVITIRQATPDDAAEISEFARRLFDTTFGPDNDPDDMRAYMDERLTPAAQARELADPSRRYLLLECDGALAGYALLGIGQTASCVNAQSPVELTRFYVDGPWHGRGVAQRLMGEVLRVASDLGADVVWLGVWERNPRAIRFYENVGFVDVGSYTFMLGADPQIDRVMVVGVQQRTGDSG